MNEPYACTECGAEFRTTLHLKSHARGSHRSVPVPQCNYCKQVLVNLKDLQEHVRLVHACVCGRLWARGEWLQEHRAQCGIAQRQLQAGQPRKRRRGRAAAAAGTGAAKSASASSLSASTTTAGETYWYRAPPQELPDGTVLPEAWYTQEQMEQYWKTQAMLVRANVDELGCLPATGVRLSMCGCPNVGGLGAGTTL